MAQRRYYHPVDLVNNNKILVREKQSFGFPRIKKYPRVCLVFPNGTVVFTGTPGGRGCHNHVNSINKLNMFTQNYLPQSQLSTKQRCKLELVTGPLISTLYSERRKLKSCEIRNPPIMFRSICIWSYKGRSQTHSIYSLITTSIDGLKTVLTVNLRQRVQYIVFSTFEWRLQTCASSLNE